MIQDTEKVNQIVRNENNQMILQGPILTPLRQAQEQEDDQTSNLSLRFPSPNFITQTKPLHQTI